MRLGYKAHGDSYNALGGTETGWQADYKVRGDTYKALKLQGDGAEGGNNSYKGTIHSLEGRFRAEGELLHDRGIITRFGWLEAFWGEEEMLFFSSF